MKGRKFKLEYKNIEQIRKALKIMIFVTVIMCIGDFLFWDKLPLSQGISSWIQSLDKGSWMLWAGIWLIMFLQTTIIPIPALIVLNAAFQVNLFPSGSAVLSSSSFWIFCIVTLTAYMCGAVAAYLLGAKFGKKAIKWCAGSDEDYKKWSSVISSKGKWVYAGTVILPIFPDDLLCIVAGSLRFNFRFFFWSNLIGRGVGLVTMLLSLTVVNNFSSGSSIPWSTIFWFAASIAMIILYYILKGRSKRMKEKI